MFLHFGELHLVFNMLWLWYFGKQLEAIHSSWYVAALIIIIAFVSNTAQYLMSETRNFGGMSGVIYGLMAYAWVVHTARPQSYLSLNRNLLTFFVIALVAMELVASSMIATAAHVGGLISGLLLGAVAVLVAKKLVKATAVGTKPTRFNIR
jgi:GlpG protein